MLAPFIFLGMVLARIGEPGTAGAGLAEEGRSVEMEVPPEQPGETAPEGQPEEGGPAEAE
jgi:hypothetical protein